MKGKEGVIEEGRKEAIIKQTFCKQLLCAMLFQYKDDSRQSLPYFITIFVYS